MKNKWELSELLGKKNYSVKKIIFLASNSETSYTHFLIPKRNGKTRQISAPNSSLKVLQKLILYEILYKKSVSNYSFGFVPNRSIILNAKEHLNSKVILKIDLVDFFWNISQDRVEKVLRFFFNFNYETSNLLARILCLNERLPQGAPTSPCIANFVAYWLDQRLGAFCKKNKLNYTRYADDLTISGERIKNSIKKKIFAIIEHEEFKINFRKTKFFSKRHRQRVTGITINEGLSVGRNNYRKMRSILHSCKKNGIENTLNECKEFDFSKGGKNSKHFMHFLQGHIRFIMSVNHNQGNKLMEEFKQIDWTICLPLANFQEQLNLMEGILEKINNLNTLVNGRFLSIEIPKIVKLYKQCKGENEFSNLCISLDDIFKNINVQFFINFIIDKSKIMDADGKIISGSGKIINTWLVENGKKEFEIFSDLSDFSISPRHSGEKPCERFLKVLKKYKNTEGLTNQYEGLWVSILKKANKEISYLNNEITLFKRAKR